MWPQGQGVAPYMGHQIPHVQNKDALGSLIIQPNSDELVLDQTKSVVYHVRSDSFGKTTLVGEYDITPKQPEPDRLDVIEQKLEKLMEMMNHE